MATQMFELLMRGHNHLRYQPVQKRVRVLLGGDTVVDTVGAALVWEPRRVVASYAVPISDVSGELVEAASFLVEAEERPVSLEEGGPPVLDPSTGFGFHTTPGTELTLRSGELSGAAFKPDDPDLNSMVILDFDAFEWLEEDELIFGHPRDPFSRIDLRQSSRHIEIEVAGTRVADSNRPLLLFEFVLPSRYYLPKADVLLPLEPSTTATVCAYKGQATHWSAVELGDEGRDIAWSYESPPPELAQITGLVCFYQERVDMIMDGVRLDRPITPWSSPPNSA
jgi:uncharacterized protein (DUF427 family)